MRPLARAVVLAPLAALVLGACTYDYSRIPRADSPRDAGTLPIDGGASVRCDPIGGGGCMTSLACSAYVDASGMLTARCATAGTSGVGAGCSGTGQCGLGLTCLSTSAGSASCQFLCTDTEECPTGACDRSAAVFTYGAVSAYRCR